MSKDELIAKLKDANKNYDPYGNHLASEDILFEFINDPEIAELWKKLSEDWWYA